MEERYIKLFRILALLGSLLALIMLIMMGIEEYFSRDWETYQEKYQKIAGEYTLQSPEMSRDYRTEIHQIVVDPLNLVDRCPSCHLGIENPALQNAPQPLGSHPGDILSFHPPEKYGCTTCHRGNGRVLEIQDVCQSSEVKSIHSRDYIQSACGKCHLAIFDENPVLPGAEKLYRGLSIFKNEGCLGCHKLRQVGGIIGPDLTEQGNKIRGSYRFRYISGPLTIPNWLKEHFLHPDQISPGSAMLAFDLPEKNLEALITFTLGLFRPDYPLEFYSFHHLREFKQRRRISKSSEIFGMFCAACHGKQGEGKNYQENKTGVPTLDNQDFQAVASRDFIEFSILKGRSGRQMSAWNPEITGLYEEEIQKVVEFVREWRKKGPNFKTVKNLTGDLPTGRILYLQNCAFCHGENGQGGIAVTLNNQDFLTLADDEFIFQTLIHGRSNTAMPAWSRFSADQFASLLKLIRSWQNNPTVKYNPGTISGNVNRGQDLFDHLCIRCHGRQGSGGIGPAILNRDFLKVASDQFLYQTISRGRTHTAMFGWAQDLGKLERIKNEDMRDLIAFMKSRADSIPEQIHSGQSVGRAAPGAKLYEKHCSECHGYNGEGKQAPALHNQEFLSAASNGFLLATISLGREGTTMPSWGRGSEKYPALTGSQRNDIVAFLRSWHLQIIKKTDK
ncbi:MAG: c-type cytochrome [bacterium]|nr:MAG: c-type cytochrome [bacterium]